MNRRQKLVAIGSLVVATVLAVLMYWSQHLTYAAGGVEDAGERVRTLQKAALFWPFNDRALYELGKARLDLGLENIADKEAGKTAVQESAESFVRSLRLDPGNFYAHYNYARALFYLDYLSSAGDIDFLQEYKKAAALTGHRNEIYFEVGRIFLSRWQTLSLEDQEFAVKILKKITDSGNKEQFTSILHTWELNVGDYAVMGRILPDNPGLLRVYAQFLGEKSLDHKERQKVLALAEQLEFQGAKDAFSRGEHHFRYYRIKEAAPYYERCLNMLKNIKFYQRLTGKNRIDMPEYEEMLKVANLKLAQCKIQQGVDFLDAEGYLRAYLRLSTRVADASELDSYLVDKKVITDKLEDSISNLHLLSFQCYLYYKQNHYRDIKNIGDLLEKSFVVVPEENKQDYIDVLRWVAASHQITGYFYDASDYFQKALALDEDNVATLLGMRRNFERLSDERGIRQIDRHLEELLGSLEIDVGGTAIGKGQHFVQHMILDGSTVSLRMEFDDAAEGGSVFPLVTVALNGRVMWEDYLRENTAAIQVESQEGDNLLEITPINRDVTLNRIVRR